MLEGKQEGQRLEGLPLIADDVTQLLIVGTFPGSESLRLGQYYANKRNQFWRFLSAAHQDNYERIDYQYRIARLLLRRVGLWDVYKSCLRRGSSDKEIRDPWLNDVGILKQVAPALRTVAFNGQKAAKHATAFRKFGYEVTVLPSSSPANAHANFANKADQWAALIMHYDIRPVEFPKAVVPQRPITAEMIRRGICEGRK